MGKRFFKQTVRDIDVERQTVLVKVDYNVPLNSDGTIADDLRIKASLPTLRYLLENQCKLVLISHLGRPEGRDPKYSLAPVAARLAELLGRSVKFIDEVTGDKVKQTVKHTPCGAIVLLENLRFYKEEEEDSESFAQDIVKSTGAAVFVQDGFGVIHRNHASVHQITLKLPSFAGLLVEKEYSTITRAIESPARPLVAIVGGAKISDKIDMIQQFIDKADKILIGGAMANTFLKFKGYDIGKSVAEDGLDETMRQIYAKAAEKVGPDGVDDFLVLPRDLAIGSNTDDKQQDRREVPVDKLSDEDMALDIGSQTIDTFSRAIKDARTIVWNGPMGYSSIEAFSYGSARTALAVAANKLAVSIIGGGDTADFVNHWNDDAESVFTHISTGGGSSLELMSGKKLVGVESLLDAHGIGVVK